MKKQLYYSYMEYLEDLNSSTIFFPLFQKNGRSGISLDRNIFHYIKRIPRYFELFSEIKNTRKEISKQSFAAFLAKHGAGE